MRRICVITTSRADYSIYTPILKQIQEHPELRLQLVVSGMHLSPEFGFTVQAIEADGFEIADRIEMLLSSDTPEATAKSMGLGMIGFAQTYARSRPDLLLVLGDRFEMHAAVTAALPFTLPVAHIHGGERSEGAIDDSLRHSITKMSHLHFVATEEYKRRVIQMGEEPWRVIHSGAPGLDNVLTTKFLSRAELQRQFSVNLREPFLLVTYHPATLEQEDTARQIEDLLQALNEVNATVIFTSPNADVRSHAIRERIREYARQSDRAQLVMSLGTEGYFSMMRHAAAMVGNSSSGIIEAASLKLPVVNIGNRQHGRVRARNVVDVDCNRQQIVDGIRQAMTQQFRDSLSDLSNPYGDGHAAARILQTLASVKLDNKLVTKRFHEA